MKKGLRKELSKLSNLITLSRFFLVFLAYIPIFLGEKYWFAAIFFLAGLTDVLDGYFARTMKITSSFGSRLDTLADNFMHYSIFIWLYVMYRQVFIDYILWLFLLLAVIIIYTFVCLVKFKKYFGNHSFLNKANSFLTFVFVLYLFLLGFSEIFFYCLAVSLIFAYIYNIYQLFRMDVSGKI